MIPRKINTPKIVMACLIIIACTWPMDNICYCTMSKTFHSANTPGGENRFSLTVNNNRLSLVARNASLNRVLSEMTRLTGVKIHLDPGIKSTVNASFRGLSLEKAIKVIAPNWAIVFAENAGAGAYTISEIIVPASGKGLEAASGLTREALKHEQPIVSKPLPDKPQDNLHDSATACGSKLSPAYAGFVPSELLVRFQKSASMDETDRLILAKGMMIKRRNVRADYAVVCLPANLPVKKAATWLASQALVDFAQPNYILSTQAFPDDPRYLNQWALENIDAESAWNLDTGSREVVIAVIDTGVNYNHPDLAANIWQNPGEISGNGVDDDANGFIDDTIGWDFVDGPTNCNDNDCEERDNDPMDFQGHGTHVAGIAGAVTNNNIGVAGVAWDCSLMAVRAGYENFSGNGKLELDDAVDAIRYAADNGAHVLNLSWGGIPDDPPTNPDDAFPLLKEAITYAAQYGVIICAAAGNNGVSDELWPAAYSDPLVLAVGSTDDDNHRAGSSNYGDWVDVSAPGVNILSTCVGGGYCEKSGTSMATPHVAGLAGLMFSRFSGWSSLLIKDMILEAVLTFPGLSGQNITSGIINLNYALEMDDSEFSYFTARVAEFFGTTGWSPEDFCQGDLDGDGDVDGTDLALLSRH